MKKQLFHGYEKENETMVVHENKQKERKKYKHYVNLTKDVKM